MRNNHNLIRPEEWGLTCIRYKLKGEPKPLDAVDGVLVKDEREQKRVEEYLEELYEFPCEKDYQSFLGGFIVKDDGKGREEQTKNKKGLKINQS